MARVSPIRSKARARCSLAPVSYASWPPRSCALAYRHSRFRAERRIVFGDDGQPVAAARALIEPAEMITGATFLLTRDDPAAVRERVQHHLRYRKETQPTQKSAGSVFKNPLPAVLW